MFLTHFFSEFFHQCRTILSLTVRVALTLCLSQCPGILSVICTYVKKRFDLDQCVIEKLCIIINFVCIHTSLDSDFFVS